MIEYDRPVATDQRRFDPQPTSNKAAEGGKGPNLGPTYLDPTSLAPETPIGPVEIAATIDRLANTDLPDAEILATWKLLLQQAPGNHEVLAGYVQALKRLKQFTVALELVNSHLPEPSTDLETRLLRAKLLDDARAHDAADTLFAALVHDVPQSHEIRFSFAERLLTRGLVFKAHAVLSPVRDSAIESKDRAKMVRKIERLCSLLRDLEGDVADPDQETEMDGRILAMKHAILNYRERSTPPLPEDRAGRIVLMTGSLGPGGAERQISRLAAELEIRRKTGRTAGGLPIIDPVVMVVRSHGPEDQKDFFLPVLLAQDVLTEEINAMPATPLSIADRGDQDLRDLLGFLPSPVNFGVKRLVNFFRENDTEMLSVWQDGAALFAGLAALIAGVPRIQIGVRGLPPSVRRHLFKPEYEALYRAMAAVPGVQFLSNSHAAAKAYAAWLDIPEDRFSIVYNGVDRMDVTSSPMLQQQWREFEARTADATTTIGGVFRLDTDKRPSLWIRFAHRHLRKYPATRFVIVGGGRLLPDAQKLAEDLGIADRILFVGRSNDVGFWMSKFHLLVLMSRYEGLPNVLIEAQFMGVPVVTTPAGGARECFIDDVTGLAVDCAENVDLTQASELAHDLTSRTDWAAVFESRGTAFLEANFSTDRMVDNFVNSLRSGAQATASCAMKLGEVT